jgi:cell division protease FtsH
MGKSLRNKRLWYFIILLMVLVVLLVRVLSPGSSNVKELNSQQFLAAVHNREFVTTPTNPDNQLTVHDQSQEVTGELKGGQQFTYYYPHNYNMAAVLNKASIPFVTDAQTTGIWPSLIASLAPILLIILFFISFMTSMQGGGERIMSFGKSRAKLMSKDAPKVTFSDVAGADEAVQELTEIKEFLEAPWKFQKLGARIPKGVLLVGASWHRQDAACSRRSRRSRRSVLQHLWI